MKIETMNDAFVHELKDLLSAERQLIKALPKMAKASHNEKLVAGFKEHLAETQEHAARLEKILTSLDETFSRVEKCKAMEGLIAEGSELMEAEAPPEIMDAMLIGAAQRVEHYEIAAYGTARTFARQLGETDAEKLLQMTLDEEGATDKKLTELAETVVNLEAAEVA
ncbi:ferritin-like domain-containing protein [Phragmitibacter flavus]|uniref:Ferritin-like domain-containing protein n=1 Tax=Phragmitibacter flavus TaxID=2576071 RepID=A0A5R8KJU8_9BACT|nr:ferritin-like domain-containing protein [Phragmitibacter flavus]TLD72527.1 ferritin-like domain-containing protein [Phragmitibacter flavus]